MPTFVEESRNEIDENASSSDVSQVEAVVCTLKDESGEANAADCQGICRDTIIIILSIPCSGLHGGGGGGRGECL